MSDILSALAVILAVVAVWCGFMAAYYFGKADGLMHARRLMKRRVVL